MFFEVKASIRRQINCSKFYGKKIRKFTVLTSSICSSILYSCTNQLRLSEWKKTFLYGIVFCVWNVPLRNAQRFFHFNFFSAAFFSHLFWLKWQKKPTIIYAIILFCFCNCFSFVFFDLFTGWNATGFLRWSWAWIT